MTTQNIQSGSEKLLKIIEPCQMTDAEKREYNIACTDDFDTLVGDIMLAAYQIQIQTSFAIFVHYSSHVNAISITIGKSREDYTNELYNSHFYTSGELKADISFIKEELKILRGIANTGLIMRIEKVKNPDFSTRWAA